MLQDEINALVRDVRGALGAIMLDFEGEAVVASSNGFSTYDLKVLGAYGSIYFDQLRKIGQGTTIGDPISFAIDGKGCRLLGQSLRDGYYVVFILSRNSNVAIARNRLLRCTEQLLREL